jgi:hypothetical protein
VAEVGYLLLGNRRITDDVDNWISRSEPDENKVHDNNNEYDRQELSQPKGYISR